MKAPRVRKPMLTAMLEHAAYEAPREACGLLAVTPAGSVRFVYCLSNVDRSASSYTIDPAEFYGAARHAERHDWEIGGVFHSHPRGTPVPSATDVARAPSPAWLYLVVSDDTVGAFEIVAKRSRQLEIEIDD